MTAKYSTVIRIVSAEFSTLNCIVGLTANSIITKSAQYLKFMIHYNERPGKKTRKSGD